MRFSKLFTQTLRQAPAEADVKSHQLLLRAGFIRPLSAGIFSYMPIGLRTLRKIENIIRQELNSLGGQEILMPVVQPAEIWKETGRWNQIGSELVRFQDRANRDLVLAMTHEEVVGDLTRHEIFSYRQLPQLIYHIQTKFRDEPRSRAGLIRTREFIMKDSYSLDVDYAGLDRQYDNHYQAYFKIFHRCGLPVIAVRSDMGIMGGSMAHEFMYLTPIGEDKLMICDENGYAANSEVACFSKFQAAGEELLALKKIATPGAKTIEELSGFLNIPVIKTAKAVFLMVKIFENSAYTEKFVLAIIRGDLDVNETKLCNIIKASQTRPATEEEIAAAGAVPGYGSAIGVKNALVVVDDSIVSSPNLVAGANEFGFHLLNTNFKRDYQADIVADIALAKAGHFSPTGTGILREVRGVEVGNIFKLGTRYSNSLNCKYLDSEGNEKPVIMGSYGIGIGRLMACIAEEHNDQQGLTWPITVAPFQVHLISVDIKNEQINNTAETVYSDLKNAGVEVLFDDRDERPGVKFIDADLMGIPLRVTIGAKSLAQGCAEVKHRAAGANQLIRLESLVEFIQSEIETLTASITADIS